MSKKQNRKVEKEALENVETTKAHRKAIAKLEDFELETFAKTNVPPVNMFDPFARPSFGYPPSNTINPITNAPNGPYSNMFGRLNPTPQAIPQAVPQAQSLTIANDLSNIMSTLDQDNLQNPILYNDILKKFDTVNDKVKSILSADIERFPQIEQNISTLKSMITDLKGYDKMRNEIDQKIGTLDGTLATYNKNRLKTRDELIDQRASDILEGIRQIRPSQNDQKDNQKAITNTKKIPKEHRNMVLDEVLENIMDPQKQITSQLLREFTRLFEMYKDNVSTEEHVKILDDIRLAINHKADMKPTVKDIQRYRKRISKRIDKLIGVYKGTVRDEDVDEEPPLNDGDDDEDVNEMPNPGYNQAPLQIVDNNDNDAVVDEENDNEEPFPPKSPKEEDLKNLTYNYLILRNKWFTKKYKLTMDTNKPISATLLEMINKALSIEKDNVNERNYYFFSLLFRRIDELYDAAIKKSPNNNLLKSRYKAVQKTHDYMSEAIDHFKEEALKKAVEHFEPKMEGEGFGSLKESLKDLSGMKNVPHGGAISPKAVREINDLLQTFVVEASHVRTGSDITALVRRLYFTIQDLIRRENLDNPEVSGLPNGPNIIINNNNGAPPGLPPALSHRDVSRFGRNMIYVGAPLIALVGGFGYFTTFIWTRIISVIWGMFGSRSNATMDELISHNQELRSQNNRQSTIIETLGDRVNILTEENNQITSRNENLRNENSEQARMTMRLNQQINHLTMELDQMRMSFASNPTEESGAILFDRSFYTLVGVVLLVLFVLRRFFSPTRNLINLDDLDLGNHKGNPPPSHKPGRSGINDKRSAGNILDQSGPTRHFREMIGVYGNDPIVSITIVRQKIPGLINAMYTQLIPYDKLYHLSMHIKVNHNGAAKLLVLEKQSFVNLNESIRVPSDAEYLDVPPPFKTLNECFKEMQIVFNSRLWAYHPFQNNCQIFVLMFLASQNKITDAVKAFVLQDKVQEYKNPYVEKFSVLITRLHGLIKGNIMGGVVQKSIRLNTKLDSKKKEMQNKLENLEMEEERKIAKRNLFAHKGIY